MVLLNYDGRCRWLDAKVLRGIFPQMKQDAKGPGPKKYLIVDWVSSDGGKVGMDLDWMRAQGIPAVQGIADLPDDEEFAVVNTGYDSIVNEEAELRSRGVEIIDLPCPYVRRLRRIFEAADPNVQYLFLCEPNHVVIKNYASIFPDEMILIQKETYRERIRAGQNEKPMVLVPYVTFLPRTIREIADFINAEYPRRSLRVEKTQCMWVDSRVSPIREIREMDLGQLSPERNALLITTPGSVNKSLLSLMETMETAGLTVHPVSSLDEFSELAERFARQRVLLVRSPIPNEAEAPIMEAVRAGFQVRVHADAAT